MATDDLIAALQGVGRVDSEGSFSFDREKAREKLRTFQVAEPQRYVLHFIAVAALKGATRIEVMCDSDDLIVRFDGAAITTEDLDDLYNASFAAAHTDDQRARQQLAIGIHAALALNPRHVRVVSGADQGVSLLARHDAADVVEPAKHTGGTQIHVKQRFRPGLLVRFVSHLRGNMAEATWLRARGLHATLPIMLNGEAIAVGLTLAGAEHCESGVDGHCRGVAGLLPGRGQGVVRLVRHGVWICDEVGPWMPLGMTVVIANDRLLTDLSGDKVVLDAEHASCLTLARRLAAQVVAGALGPGTAVDPDAGLRERLQGVWTQWNGALDPRTAIGAAMTRVIAWPDIWGRRHSFAALEAEARRVEGLPITTADLAELLPVSDEIILRSGDLLLDHVLKLGLTGRVRDATAELEQRARTGTNRRRWRAQPCEPTLTAANYVMIADFSVQVGERRIHGQVGLRRVPGERCHLRAIVDGCVLTEFELGAPIAGADVVLSGPLAVLPDCSGLERDALFAAALAGWTTTARVLVEAAVRSDALDWPPDPAAQALVHGLVRAHHPAAALRSVLADAGYDEAAQAQHLELLLPSMPAVPIADLCEQQWIRDSVQFMTATGPQLSLGAVVVALSHAMVVECVSDQLAPHPGLKGLVLRVTPGERELLGWLFGDRIASLPDEEYERRLAEAHFMGRLPQLLMLDLDTNTTSVIVEHDGLRVAMAFPRTTEGWEANQVRSTCAIFHSSRLMGQVRIWSPVPGVSFAIVGDALTPRPHWDGVRLDDAFHAATAAAAAAVPSLVRAAISAARRDPEIGESAWSRGVLAALVASFPSPQLRAAYVHLLATKGCKVAEKHYLKLLALAAASSVHAVSRAITDDTANPGVLMDLCQLAARVSVKPPTSEQIRRVADVLGELRELLGQVGGESWVHHVGNFSLEVGELPLFRRVGGSVITLTEAVKEARTEKLHVYVDTGGRPSSAHMHSLRADPLTFEQLGCLLGSAYLSTAARRGPASEEQRPVRRTSPKRPEPEPARRKPAVVEDAPPSAEDLVSLFAELQREADQKSPARPAKPAAVAAAAQSTPRPPDPGEKLVAAVQAELRALRCGHESLLTGFNLDHVRAFAGSGKAMVSITRDGLIIDLEHPLVKQAVERHTGDRLWISFLASCIYTALNVWREDITDVDEAAFHARHLAWLRGELER